VRLTSRKSPRALEGAPFLAANGISLDGLTEERLLFSGPAREAVRGFPDNLNISAALSLAGIGPDATQVSISAVPGLSRNCHDIEVEGEFGMLRVHIENIPSENPKTGRLTALSIIKAVEDAVDYVRVGT
jgi:aspartate dehydrogenase